MYKLTAHFFQSADMMFRLEEYTIANTLIEQCIAYMQFVAHPSFQLTDVSNVSSQTFKWIILAIVR